MTIQRFKTIQQILITTTILFYPFYCQVKSNNQNQETNNNSFFENYKLKKTFLIVDNANESDSTFTYYNFNIYAKSNTNLENNLEEENQFILDMENYSHEYPEISIATTQDLTHLENGLSQELTLSKSILTPIKLKNDFYKLELEISKNNCLTLLMFLDSEEETQMKVFTDKHDVSFDFKGNSGQTFNQMVQNYWGHTKESFDVVYNDSMLTSEDVFLKVVCPFYSGYSEKEQIQFKISKFHESYFLDGKSINYQFTSLWTFPMQRKR